MAETNMTSVLFRRHAKHELSACRRSCRTGACSSNSSTAMRRSPRKPSGLSVVRHGPMVLGICRHVLNDEHDAEDAFQATFLVLAQKGCFDTKSKGPGGLAPRSCSSDRDQGAGQRRSTAHTRKAGHGDVAHRKSNRTIRDEAAAWNELRPVLHAEVDRLPEKYRLPVILVLPGRKDERRGCRSAALAGGDGQGPAVARP